MQSFELVVQAKETNTNERFDFNVTVLVEVLDVNDLTIDTVAIQDDMDPGLSNLGGDTVVISGTNFGLKSTAADGEKAPFFTEASGSAHTHASPLSSPHLSHSSQ